MSADSPSVMVEGSGRRIRERSEVREWKSEKRSIADERGGAVFLQPVCNSGGYRTMFLMCYCGVIGSYR